MAVLSIGTIETHHVAGLGLDLRILGARRIPVRTVVAGVSAQSAAGVHVTAVGAAGIAAQFATIDVATVGAIRIGALPDVASVAAVAAALDAFSGVPIVLDPVVVTSLGASLTLEPTVEALRAHLVPRATIVLPNLAEAGQLTGVAISGEDGMARAATLLVRAGTRAALVTGGHLAGDPIDVLVDGSHAAQRFVAPRLERDMRGTGCVLAASLAAELVLVRGAPRAKDAAGHAALVRAIEAARATVRTTIAHAVRVGDRYVAS